MTQIFMFSLSSRKRLRGLLYSDVSKLGEVEMSPKRYVICKDFTLLILSMRFTESDKTNVAALFHGGCGVFLGGFPSLTVLKDGFSRFWFSNEDISKSQPSLTAVYLYWKPKEEYHLKKIRFSLPLRMPYKLGLA